ncbi:MAG: cytochrome c biogenesis protein CcsA [Thermoplasmatota archaeon]
MAHDVNGIMVLIHPPLSILGYIITMISLKAAVQIVFGKKGGPGRLKKREGDLRLSLYIAWGFTFLGLVTGMIWAQLAWGSFWSWDPKETATLAVFLTLTAALILQCLRADIRWVLLALIVNVLSIAVTVSMSFVKFSVHSYV